MWLALRHGSVIIELVVIEQKGKLWLALRHGSVIMIRKCIFII